MKPNIALALCALAIAIPGVAQQQGGPPGGGPPRMGGPGQARMGGPNILMAPDVQKELNLSVDQKAKLGALFGGQNGGGPQGGQPGFGGPPPGQRGSGNFGGPPPQQGGQGGPPQGGGPQGNQDMEKRRAEMDAKVKAILNDAQYARYQELLLQQRGAEAMTEKKVADRLGLSQEQRKEIRVVLEENRPTPPRPGQGGQPDFQEMRKQMEARKKLVNEKIVAVLTNDQRATWTKMLGKPFTFQQFGRGGN